MSHMPHTIQTNVQVIGRGNDGSILHSWNEGSRRFIEVYEYHRTQNYIIGLVIVKEIT